MKKNINLLIKQKKYLNEEKFFYYLKIYTYVLFSVFFISIIINLFFLIQNSKKIDLKKREKETYLQYLLKNKEVEAKFVYFRNKSSQIENILENDVNFYPYYNLLKDGLKYASPEPVIESIAINKDRTTSFMLGFDSTPQLLAFLKFAESPDFLKNFSELSLHQFNLEENKDVKNYKLGLVGKFNLIDETKN